jgi:hypothetical protein
MIGGLLIMEFGSSIMVTNKLWTIVVIILKLGLTGP